MPNPKKDQKKGTNASDEERKAIDDLAKLMAKISGTIIPVFVGIIGILVKNVILVGQWSQFIKPGILINLLILILIIHLSFKVIRSPKESKLTHFNYCKSLFFGGLILMAFLFFLILISVGQE